MKFSSLEMARSQPAQVQVAQHGDLQNRPPSGQAALICLWPIMLLSAAGLGISLLAVVLSFSARLNLGGLPLLSALQLLALVAIGRLIWNGGRL